MKKLCFFALLALCMATTACNRKSCWKCTTIFSGSETPFPAVPGTSAARATYCDKTEAEIRQIEKDGTGVQTYTSNGKTHSSSAATTCK